MPHLEVHEAIKDVLAQDLKLLASELSEVEQSVHVEANEAE